MPSGTRSAFRAATMCIALICAASPALARPDTRTMTCAQAKTYVQQNKAIVMSTGQYTYMRIVSGRGSCAVGQTTKRFLAPTIDTPKCQVGYECRDVLFD